MELIFEKEDLSKAIQILQGVASGRNTLPILSNVLIRAGAGQIEIAATDLEVGIRMNVAGQIQEEGEITVSARKLGEIVRELPEEDIRISTVGNDRVEIVCGSGKYKIIGLPSDEFPPIPSIDGSSFTISGEELRSMIQRTEFAASTDEARYYLNGLFFNLTEESTQIVGTDGHHLSIVTEKSLEPKPDEPISVIVPLKAVREVLKTFSDSSSIQFSVKGNQILFADDGATLVSRLVDGEYPKYEGIIPDNNDIQVVVEREKLIGTVRRVSLLANQNTHSVRLELENNQMRLSARTPELGEGEETLDVGGESEGLEIALDARYLRNVLSHIDAHEVIMGFKDSVSIAIIKPVEDDSHLCLIMPMRLNT